MISFSCKCGKKYEVPEKYAGKKVRCKKCNNMIRVPCLEKDDSAVMMTEIIEPESERNSTQEHNTKQSVITSVSENSGLPKPLIYTFIGIGILFIGFILYFLAFRDTWERDNLMKISQMISEATQQYNLENDAGLETYEELCVLIGDRELKNERLRLGYSDVQEKYNSLKARILAQKRRIAKEKAAAERKRKEEQIARKKEIEEQEKARAEAAEKQQKVIEFKNHLMALIEEGEKYSADGDVEKAIQVYEKALRLVHQNSLPSELKVDSELQTISKTLEDGISKLRNIHAHAERVEQEQSKKEEAKKKLDNAIYEAVEYGLKRVLYAPSTTRVHSRFRYHQIPFSDLTDASIEMMRAINRDASKNLYFHVSGDVDAQNRFGAMLTQGWVFQVAVQDMNGVLVGVALDGGIL